MKTAILGYGVLGKHIHANLISDDKSVDVSSFDDSCGDYNFQDYKMELNKFKWLIGLGYHHLKLKREITQHIINNAGVFSSCIHSSCYISNSALIKTGVVCFPNCTIDTNVSIEHSAFLHNSVIVSHDSKIGEASYLSPGVIISGFVTIGHSCFLGSGVVVANNVTIGHSSVIGIGTVVTRDVPPNSNVIGNPMRIIDKPLNLK